MECKTLILSVFIMSLVTTQIQVEADVTCCPDTTSRGIYKTCRFAGGALEACVKASGCKIRFGRCPPGFTDGISDNSGDSEEYCNLGCASSVCGALITLQNSDTSEIVNEAVEQCTKACSTLCNKDSKTALETF